jgi:metal-dependent amidase/aminoacylase/carboxypeptidase family protein
LPNDDSRTYFYSLVFMLFLCNQNVVGHHQNDFVGDSVLTDRTTTKLEWDMMIENIKKINEGIAVANGLPKNLYPTLNIKQDLGTLKNDEALTAKINTALEKIAGPGRNFVPPLVMGSEDVQELLRDYPNVPYCYFIVGIANPEVFQKAVTEGKKFPYSNHNPDFWVDLPAIPFGTKLGAAAALEAFKK